MTLIVTVVTRKWAVQASDLRLTSVATDQPHDDLAVKQAFVQTHNASFSVAYTGVTNLGDGSRRNSRADRIILNYLADARAGSKELGFILEQLRKEVAPVVLEESEAPVERRRLTIVIAGFVGLSAFASVITNWENLDTGRPQPIGPEFAGRWWRIGPTETDEEKLVLLIHGMTPAVMPEMRSRIRHLRKVRFFQQSEGTEVVEEAVRIIRSAADSPNRGRYIGKNCVSNCIPLDATGENLGQFHPWEYTGSSYFPHALVGEYTYKDIVQYVDTGQGPPDWWRT